MTVPCSKLFLAGNRLETLDAALAAHPDALSLDLEDAIPEQSKADARRVVAALLHATRLPCAAWVRVNGVDSGHFVADVLALQGAHVDVVNLPKVEDPSSVRLLEELLRHIEDAESASGRLSRIRPIRIVPTIETPLGLRHAAAIAAASPRVLALQLGAGDLTRRTGIEPGGPGHDLLRVTLSLAAAEAGVAALDSTPHGMHDLGAFEADARRAKSLGFQGKSCMLDSQVAVARAVFAKPS
jgi:citrate lyase subunit beta/citryl-CoA lyase